MTVAASRPIIGTQHVGQPLRGRRRRCRTVPTRAADVTIDPPTKIFDADATKIVVDRLICKGAFPCTRAHPTGTRRDLEPAAAASRRRADRRKGLGGNDSRRDRPAGRLQPGHGARPVRQQGRHPRRVFLHEYVATSTPIPTPPTPACNRRSRTSTGSRPALPPRTPSCLRAMFVATFEAVKTTSPLRDRVRVPAGRRRSKVERRTARRASQDGSVRRRHRHRPRPSTTSPQRSSASPSTGWSLPQRHDLERELDETAGADHSAITAVSPADVAQEPLRTRLHPPGEQVPDVAAVDASTTGRPSARAAPARAPASPSGRARRRRSAGAPAAASASTDASRSTDVTAPTTSEPSSSSLAVPADGPHRPRWCGDHRVQTEDRRVQRHGVDRLQMRDQRRRPHFPATHPATRDRRCLRRAATAPRRAPRRPPASCPRRWPAGPCRGSAATPCGVAPCTRAGPAAPRSSRAPRCRSGAPGETSRSIGCPGRPRAPTPARAAGLAVPAQVDDRGRRTAEARPRQRLRQARIVLERQLLVVQPPDPPASNQS